ncbi:BA75_03087T0 [Komagataella pastoris]|uniref:Stress response protein NST1 n=1 Tax=Komagataella pastoris TaxID=4922 RepID=A0A1B2JDH7_PICPA|nr:BA75_03087T0 [Komagataella pastoris]
MTGTRTEKPSTQDYVAGRDVMFDYQTALSHTNGYENKSRHKNKSHRTKKIRHETPPVSVDINDPDAEYPVSRVIKQTENGEVVVSEYQSADPYNFWGALTINSEEHEGLKEFWNSMTPDERKSLVSIDKEELLSSLKYIECGACRCQACGDKKALEKDLIELYDSYYAHIGEHDIKTLEPFFSNDLESFKSMLGDHECFDTEVDLESEEYESDERDYEHEHHTTCEPLAQDLPTDNTDTIQDGQIEVKMPTSNQLSTIADDILNHDGRSFITMMERLAINMNRLEDCNNKNSSTSNVYGSSSTTPTNNINIQAESDVQKSVSKIEDVFRTNIGVFNPTFLKNALIKYAERTDADWTKTPNTPGETEAWLNGIADSLALKGRDRQEFIATPKKLMQLKDEWKRTEDEQGEDEHVWTDEQSKLFLERVENAINTVSSEEQEYQEVEEVTQDFEDEIYEDEDEDEEDQEILEKEYLDKKRLQQAFRMLQVMTTQIVKERFITAYREKVAEDTRNQLLAELEMEEALQKEKEKEEKRRKEELQEKKRLEEIAKEQERRRKEAEKLEEERKREEEQRRRTEEGIRRKEEQRRKKEEERRKAFEEKRRKEQELKRLEEERIEKERLEYERLEREKLEAQRLEEEKQRVQQRGSRQQVHVQNPQQSSPSHQHQYQPSVPSRSSQPVEENSFEEVNALLRKAESSLRDENSNIGQTPVYGAPAPNFFNQSKNYPSETSGPQMPAPFSGWGTDPNGFAPPSSPGNVFLSGRPGHSGFNAGYNGGFFEQNRPDANPAGSAHISGSTLFGGNNSIWSYPGSVGSIWNAQLGVNDYEKIQLATFQAIKNFKDDSGEYNLQGLFNFSKPALTMYPTLTLEQFVVALQHDLRGVLPFRFEILYELGLASRVRFRPSWTDTDQMR